MLLQPSTRMVRRGFLLKRRKERDIVQALKVHDETVYPVGETLPEEQRVYRVKVLRTFLRAAVQLSKLEIFRELLEENAYLSVRP